MSTIIWRYYGNDAEVAQRKKKFPTDEISNMPSLEVPGYPGTTLPLG